MDWSGIVAASSEAGGAPSKAGRASGSGAGVFAVLCTTDSPRMVWASIVTVSRDSVISYGKTISIYGDTATFRYSHRRSREGLQYESGVGEAWWTWQEGKGQR
jgi:hypothetical protein